MNVPLLIQLVQLVESLFKHHAPEVAKAAEQAAIQTATQGAVADPKVQAGIAAYQAIQNFQTALKAEQAAAVPPAPPAQ